MSDEDTAMETEDANNLNDIPDQDTIVFNEFKKIKGELRYSLEENKQLKIWIKELQKQIDDLKLNHCTNAKKVQSNKKTEIEYQTDEEELAKETEWIRVKHSTKNRKMNPSPEVSAAKSLQPAIQTQPARNKIPPPIVVENIDSYESLYAALTSEIVVDRYQIKLIKEDSAKINTKDADSYRSTIKILKENKYSFHTYENKQTRPIRIMMKNLHQTCKPQSIIRYLQEQGFKVIEVINKIGFKTKKPLNMFMVTFENCEDINKIYKITHVLGTKVDIEALKSSNLIPQCKNCQSYGHTKKYCARHARCVKCTGKHSTDKCDKKDDEVPKCVNCGGTHPASYRGCIVAKELQMMRNARTSQPNAVIPSNSNTDVTNRKIEKPSSSAKSINPSTSMTYANVIKSAVTSQTSQAQNAQQNVDQVLQLILEKVSSLEGSFTSINKRITTLEKTIQTSNSQQYGLP